METHAYFANIRAHLLTELETAKVSIHVAVAWFTDVRLFNLLCRKASEGMDVQLIIVEDHINSSSPIQYTDLINAGGRFFSINSNHSGNLMHNKFCIIDAATTITGSYNWSIKAGSNHENITITKGNESLAESFLSEFKRIRIQYHGNDPLKLFDISLIQKRLLVINGLIDLDETDMIKVHLNKIGEFELTSEILTIVDMLENKDFRRAQQEIEDYLKKVRALIKDDEVNFLKLRLEIKYLEIEIISLENEKSTIQKIITDFVHAYTLAFGELIKKILHLKKAKLAQQGGLKEQEFEKAKKDYEEFEQRFNKEKEKHSPKLSEEQRRVLDKLKRKGVLLCHPDKFPGDEQIQKKAEKIFKQLMSAYENNDLEKVREIVSNLENGIYEITESEQLSKLDRLIEQLKSMRIRCLSLRTDLDHLYKDRTYKDIRSIQNMDEYFKAEQLRYESELNNLEHE